MTVPAKWIRQNMFPSLDENGSPNRRLTEAEVRVKKSLERLSIPAWYLNNSSKPPKILKNDTPIESRPASWKSQKKNSSMPSISSKSSKGANKSLSPEVSPVRVSSRSSRKSSKQQESLQSSANPGQKSPPALQKSPNASPPPQKPDSTSHERRAKQKKRLNTSRTFPRMSVSRKVHNINIVLPPSPLRSPALNLQDSTFDDSEYFDDSLSPKTVMVTDLDDPDPECLRIRRGTYTIPEPLDTSSTLCRTPDFKSSALMAFKVRTASTPEGSPVPVFSTSAMASPISQPIRREPVFTFPDVFSSSMLAKPLQTSLNTSDNPSFSYSEIESSTMKPKSSFFLSANLEPSLKPRLAPFFNSTAEDSRKGSEERSVKSDPSPFFLSALEDSHPEPEESRPRKSFFDFPDPDGDPEERKVKRKTFRFPDPEGDPEEHLKPKTFGFPDPDDEPEESNLTKAFFRFSDPGGPEEATVKKQLVGKQKSFFRFPDPDGEPEESSRSLSRPTSLRPPSRSPPPPPSATPSPAPRKSRPSSSSSNNSEKRSMCDSCKSDNVRIRFIMVSPRTSPAFNEAQNSLSRHSSNASSNLAFIMSKNKSTALESIVKKKRSANRSLIQEIIDELQEKCRTSPQQTYTSPGSRNFVRKLVRALERNEDEEDLRQDEGNDEPEKNEESSGEGSDVDIKSAASSTSLSFKDSDSGSDVPPSPISSEPDYEWGIKVKKEEEKLKQSEEEESVFWVPVKKSLPRTSSVLSILGGSNNSPAISPIRPQGRSWGNTYKKTKGQAPKKLFRIDESGVLDSGYSDRSERSSATDHGASWSDYENTHSPSEVESIGASYRVTERNSQSTFIGESILV